MITSSREKGSFEAKQGVENSNNGNKNMFKATTSSSSRPWSTFRNPRIVRVSRSFGGKDRHSKVCTIRGLRDRRIRLSVPAAIQLYDLQDRLGLNQPSKVIDWLLDATKNDIDNLPPLQIPQGFGQFHPQMLLHHHHDSTTPSQSSLSPFFDSNLRFRMKMNLSSSFGREHEHNTMARTSSKFSWDQAETDASLSGGNNNNNGKGKLIKSYEQENHDQDGLSAQRLFPLASTSHQSSFPSLFNNNNNNNNNPIPYNPYNYHLDASNLSLSQYGFVPQQPENNSTSSFPFSSPAGGGSQFLFCPPVTMPSLFPQYPPFGTTPLETNESREIGHFHLLSSGFAHSQKNSSSGRQPDKLHNEDS